jgi:23S rRNA pseudouridine1911/1915/1917 synthase
MNRTPAGPRISSPPPVFTIIDETDDYVVVNKPPSLEIHPSKPGGSPTLWDGLRELFAFEIVNGGQISIITRLDRETSGLVLAAKTRAAARHFHTLIAAQRFQKEYLALVWGFPEKNQFVVDAPVIRQGAKIPSPIYLKRMVHQAGAPARTEFHVEQRFRRDTPHGREFALLRAFPRTGRTHQIRVHLAHAGYPVVGDKIYGPDEGCYLEFIRTGWTDALQRRLLLPRHALHAAVLAVPEMRLRWEVDLHADLASWIDQMPTGACEKSLTP